MSKWIQRAGIFLGAVIAGGMFFANQLGIDNNAAWGTKRILLFALGLFLLAASILYRGDNFLGRLINTRTGQLYFASALAAGLVLLAYVWWVSLGLWSPWTPSTNYYDLMATAFRHGQLALEVEPDPALLALEDPYEPANREGIPVLWDATLYKGKYYLYWGPAPALFLTVIKFFYTPEIGDNALTFFFVAGLFLFLALLALELWKKYFQETPRWLVVAGILLLGLVNPLPFVLLDPRIYEAAVAAGQFFFVGGLYFLFTAFDKPTVPRLTLAGTFFALAVGSRTTLLIPIAFLSLVILFWVVKNQPQRIPALLSSFALPLALFGMAYGWYNFARFGSFTEFGYSYQLTGFNIHAVIDQTFSPAYIPPNLYKTLLNPFEVRSVFPFIKPTLWSPPGWVENSKRGIYYYFAESITGILVGAPFLVLAALKKKKEIFWISISLTGSTLLIFFTAQAFFYTTMRYLLDLTPALALLALTGFWSGLDSLKTRPAAKTTLTMLGVSLWAYTIVIGILLTFSSNFPRLKANNPELVQQLILTFNDLFK